MINNDNFLAEVEKLLGKENVIVDNQMLRSYISENHSLISPEMPIGMVYPHNVDEVQAIVKLAKSAGISLVPCSTEGGPRLSGSSYPSPGIKAVIVNLSQMKKILHIDVRNRIATVEAGVTFEELNEAAAKFGLRVEHPLQPRRNKSVVASLLDREPTLIPKNHWDINDPLYCMECVFGTGEVFRTGSSAGPGDIKEQWESGCGLNNPMGPGQLDLGRAIMGAQGTLGIVTWASIKLQLIPKVRKLLFIQEENIEKIEPFVYMGIRQRFGDEYVILDRFALASMVEDSKEKIGSLAAMLPKWTLIYTVGGYNYFPELRIKQQEDDLNDLAEKYQLKVQESIDGISNETIAKIIDNPSGTVHWKNRYCSGSLDIFFLSTLDRVQFFKDMMYRELKKNGFDTDTMGIYVQPTMMCRNCHIEFVIPYIDKAKAMALYAGSVKELVDSGAFFSRPYQPAAKLVYEKTPVQIQSMHKMKDLLDPERILNRGKLCY